jgi:hypothetical protein
MDLMQFLASILGQGQTQPQPGMASNWNGPDSAPNQLAMAGNAAPASAPPMAGPSGPPQTGASPAPSQGGFLSRLFGGGEQDKINHTIEWLKSTGMDEGTAQAVATNKPLLQKFLVDRMAGQKPLEVNGRLVDPSDYHVIADFSDKTAPGRRTTTIDGKLVDTDTGKVIGDYGNGEKPPTSYQEYQLAVNDGFKGTYTDWQTKSVREQDPTFGREVQLRQEYEGLPPVKTYQIVRDNYERIRQGVAQGTGAGDLAIVFGYMKMLDPTSVVREGEQAAATDVSGVPSKILNLYNSVVAGAKLPPEARTELLGAATEVYKQAAANVGDVNKRYSAIATNYQLDPTRIVQTPEEYPGSLIVGAPPPDAAPVPGTNPNIIQPAQPAPNDWREVAPGLRVRRVH